MKKEKLDIIYGVLFCSLGQLIARAEERATGTLEEGQEWIQRESVQWSGFSQGYDKEKVKQIINLSDKITCSSYKGTEAFVTNQFKPQADIFNAFGESKGNRYYDFGIQPDNQSLNLSKSEYKKIDSTDYKKLLDNLASELKEYSFTEKNLSTLLNILDKNLGYVPLAPDNNQLEDLSIAEYIRLTAGFATTIFDFIEDKEMSLDDIDSLSTEKIFLLSSFDLSGIQDFIYNIATSGAAKQLKARSLYLDFMSEYVVDSLLEELDLSRVNCLYVGGGHAYFVLPNNQNTLTKLKEFEETFNQFLLDYFQTGLYIAFGWHEFSMSEIIRDGQISLETYLKNYRDIYQGCSRMISDKKLSRYNAATLINLNKGGRSSDRECEICHSVERLENVSNGEDNTYLCHICNELRQFSKKINSNYFQVIHNDSKGLPIGPNAVLKPVTDETELNKAAKLYIKNKWHAKENAVPVFVGDYQYAEIHEYANLSKNEQGFGISRLAVVRLDVDDLGAAFMAGFSYQKDDDYSYNTFLRTAMFSRQMSLFFKFYIHSFAKDKKITIIYAGGDDVFAIGSWQDIITFTIELRENFVLWTDKKLTLSAGIGLFSDKTPISLMANYTGKLEESAKNNKKDSVTFFEEKYIFKFDQFIQRIYNEKLIEIRRYFNSQDERGKVFIYHLLELIQNDRIQDDSKININTARLAYYLARLEDLSSDEQKEKFRHFKTLFFKWYTTDSNSRKEVELALLLYLYEIRKD
ncbi:MAG: type III-A CRISPR-associated protein Cas10/Csm1 [Streptococcus sp.]|nr:type III-A CRISPR-associated protein Cas10/Csm1 [Streptococcus sp.]